MTRGRHDGYVDGMGQLIADWREGECDGMMGMGGLATTNGTSRD